MGFANGSDDGMDRDEHVDATRRGLFALAALPLLAVGLGSRAAAATPAPVCADPKTLTAGQANLRKGLKLRASTDPAKRCGGCMFFAGAADGCGKCQLLLNGPVSSGDVCDSWAKKA